jgi:catechol 2,3-dioxygenase-like lactoylglutathione lyase family enzyme
MLDHIMLGCNDLDDGIAFVEERTGVRAGFGGVHPGRGTRNAFLSLGGKQHLEIIAPDPGQTSVEAWAIRELSRLKTLVEPKLVGWVIHTRNIETFVAMLRQQGLAIQGPFPAFRAGSDGTVVRWKIATLADDSDTILPSFIEWDPESKHPSNDAPAGCRLERFEVAAPDTSEWISFFEKIEIQVPVRHNNQFQLRARIAASGGRLAITS